MVVRKNEERMDKRNGERRDEGNEEELETKRKRTNRERK